MRRLSGFVFDTYDDVDGQVLRDVVEDLTTLPPFVKAAHRLTSHQIDHLPDDQFALILLDGGEKMKKFATVDRGNTTLSVVYLLKQAHLLPPEAVKTAARNLIGACQQHGLTVPSELEKAAKSGSSSVSGKTQSLYARGAKVNKIQFPAVAGESDESHENPQLGKHDGAWDDVKERTNVEGSPGTNFMELPAFPQKERVKTASASELEGLFNAEARTKQQSWRETPYFDITGWDPSMAVDADIKPAQQTLLAGSYPIDGYDQVKTASTYFNENWKQLPPNARHEYCVKLAARMSELGMEVSEDMARYGSTTYAADVDSYVEARRAYVHDEAHSALDMLLEKRAQVSPGVFVHALAEFDRLNDLNWHWDGKIVDPWYSTFGPSLEKVASDNWRYDNTGVRISEADLQVLARNGHERLCKSFGHDFAKEFCKSPKAFFESLPAPNKLILARLASDRHAGTYTE